MTLNIEQLQQRIGEHYGPLAPRYSVPESLAALPSLDQVAWVTEQLAVRSHIVQSVARFVVSLAVESEPAGIREVNLGVDDQEHTYLADLTYRSAARSGTEQQESEKLQDLEPPKFKIIYGRRIKGYDNRVYQVGLPLSFPTMFRGLHGIAELDLAPSSGTTASGSAGARWSRDALGSREQLEVLQHAWVAIETQEKALFSVLWPMADPALNPELAETGQWIIGMFPSMAPVEEPESNGERNDVDPMADLPTGPIEIVPEPEDQLETGNEPADRADEEPVEEPSGGPQKFQFTFTVPPPKKRRFRRNK